MNRRIIQATAALISVTACGSSEEPGNAGANHHGAEEADSAPRSFVVGLDRAIAAEDAIPRILKAGRPELAAACAEHPGASIRVFNPLASDAYEDVACTAVLDGEQTGEVGERLTMVQSDEAIGEARQEIGPISFLMCGLFANGTILATRYLICPHARTARSRQGCDDTGLWSGIAMGVLCSIPL